MKKLIFFIISSALLLFSIIVINIAPTINRLVGTTWSQESCGYISDDFDDQKDKDLSNFNNDQNKKDETLDDIKKRINRCNRRKAMVGLEYVTSNLNIIFGFICALLGFLLFIGVGNMGKYIGLIGLGAGVINFVLTLVYIIESGLVFDDIPFDYDIYLRNPLDPYLYQTRIDSDGAVLEWKDNKYTCIFYNKNDKDSIYLRYSDYGKKYLNYHKDLHYPDDDKKFMLQPISIITNSGGCIYGGISYETCKKIDEGTTTLYSSKLKYYDNSHNPKGDCDKLYYSSSGPTDNSNKVLYDRWLTTIIFSCFILLLNIGLAIFGFLLFKETGGSSGSVAIK